MKILQPKINKNQTDSFFYEGEIAEITKPNGTKLRLIATGDIKIDIEENHYRNHNIHEAIDEYRLTDKKLRNLEKQDKLNWSNNNWFEVIWKTKNDDIWDSDIGIVAYDYDEALQLLQSYADDDTY